MGKGIARGNHIVVGNTSEWGLNSQPPDHQSHALPTELSHYLVVCESLRPL